MPDALLYVFWEGQPGRGVVGAPEGQRPNRCPESRCVTPTPDEVDEKPRAAEALGDDLDSVGESTPRGRAAANSVT